MNYTSAKQIVKRHYPQAKAITVVGRYCVVKSSVSPLRISDWCQTIEDAWLSAAKWCKGD